MTEKEKTRVCLGAFAGAHGVKGEARIKAFTQAPQDVGAYGPVETEDGAQHFTLTIIRNIKGGMVLVRAPEIQTREDAESLKGTRLYVDRDKLPAPDTDEFYLDDLVGLKAIDETGAQIGAVNAVYNFGAGDLIELKDIPGVKGLRMIAFTKENVPVVDIAGGEITVQRAAIEIGDETEAPSAGEGG